MASCGNKEPLQFSCDKHRQLPLHWVTIPPPPTDTVSAACSISVPSEEAGGGVGGGGTSSLTRTRDTIFDLREELQPWCGNTASRCLLLFGPLDNVAMGSEALAATLIKNRTPQSLFQSRPEMTDDDIRWNSLISWGVGQMLPKQLKFKVFINLFPNKEFSRCDSPTVSVAVTTPSVY